MNRSFNKLFGKKIKTYSLDEAQKKLEFYCAYQERSHKEVVTKLKDMRMIPDAIDVIVVHLIQNNFLNEERFAKAFVRGKFRIKKWIFTTSSSNYVKKHLAIGIISHMIFWCLLALYGRPCKVKKS